MSETSTITVRPATREDAGAIARIYNDGIRGRGATFETRERTEEDIARWFDDPRFPVLVAVTELTQHVEFCLDSALVPFSAKAPA